MILAARTVRAIAKTLTVSAVAAIAGVSAPGRAPAHADWAPASPLTLTGVLTPADRNRIIERTFVVPPGTSQVDIDLACDGRADETPVDFGAGGPAGIRGWSTARNRHVQIGAISASYGYLPGPIEPGEWRVMIGAPPDLGVGDSPYRITIRLSDRPGRSRPTIASTSRWYSGDLHVHSSHSDGAAGVSDLAARAGAARLDYLAITDHNTVSHWLDVDRTQSGTSTLLLHAREITTARGHANAIGERRFTDFRLGPLRPMRRVLSDIARDGAFVSINHAWLHSDDWCAGCGWMDRDAGTLSAVNGLEIVNGSTSDDGGTLPGWQLWSQLLNRGEHLAAVGGSDLHDPVGGAAAIGQPSTVVFAASLSEDAIVAGLKSGRVFVRARPDAQAFVDLTATGSRTTAAMGQRIEPGALTLRAHVEDGDGLECVWIRRGVEIGSARVIGRDWTSTLRVDAAGGDWFSVIVRRDRHPQLLSNAIYVEGQRRGLP